MGQLRTFNGYGKTAPYTPFAFPCALVTIDGYAAGAGYLHLYDSALGALTALTTVAVASGGSGYVVGDILAIAGGTGTSAYVLVTQVSSTGAVTQAVIYSEGNYSVAPATTNSATLGTGTLVSLTLTFTARTPKKTYPIAAAGPLPSIFVNDGAIEFNKGLVITLSSTSGTYTALATSFDVTGEINEYELPKDNNYEQVTSGDRTTGRDGLAVWTNAAGPRRLVSIYAKNMDGVPLWLMLIAQDSVPADGTVPITSWKSNDASAIQDIKLNFGKDGLLVQNTVNGVAKIGCSLYWSLTVGTLTKPGSNLSIIEAVSRKLI